MEVLNCGTTTFFASNFFQLIWWEVDLMGVEPWEVDLMGVDLVGVGFVGVDLMRVNLLSISHCSIRQP